MLSTFCCIADDDTLVLQGSTQSRNPGMMIIRGTVLNGKELGFTKAEIDILNKNFQEGYTGHSFDFDETCSNARIGLSAKGVREKFFGNQPPSDYNDGVMQVLLIKSVECAKINGKSQTPANR